MINRPYDLIIYGASGFVGKQALQYLANHIDSKQLRWAIAGRNLQKLNVLKTEINQPLDIFVAQSDDKQAIDNLVSQTRVLLNTAGPFALYANNIVDACVRFQTDYVDITGETPWVKNLIDRYHEIARANGTRIIPFCGFDSVPSDCGTYLVVRYFQQKLGIPCTKVKGYFQAYGGFNGGTLASGFNLYDSGQIDRLNEIFLLNPSKTRPLQDQKSDRDVQYFQYDADMGTWVAPFFMAVVNTRVVRRSSALYQEWDEPYGENFSYQEYLKLAPPLAWFKGAAITGSMMLVGKIMKRSLLRRMLQSFVAQPGTGPSSKTLAQGWFCCELIGFGKNGEEVRAKISDRTDPGNGATVKFLCESALSLVLERTQLPGGSQRGGILTPATALGDILPQRLQKAGMIFEIVLRKC
jgi:short subunit dehydrogenase-like uncharacterized protein